MTEQQRNAIDLLIEDLYRPHSDTVKTSKMFGCEQEFLQLRNDVIEYLRSYK